MSTTTNDYDVVIFKDYAAKNGWYHKDRQTFGWNNCIVDTKNKSLLAFETTTRNFQTTGFLQFPFHFIVNCLTKVYAAF